MPEDFPKASDPAPLNARGKGRVSLLIAACSKVCIHRPQGTYQIPSLLHVKVDTGKKGTAYLCSTMEMKQGKATEEQ